MNIRKDPLAIDHYYHIFNRSIAKYVIFNDDEDYARFIELISLCRYKDFNNKYSRFAGLEATQQAATIASLRNSSDLLAEILTYSLMPTHMHLILKQVSAEGISRFMSKILNSYTKYFNAKHHRLGPLFEGHFKDVLIKTDNQLLHVGRYIHLNPTSAGLVENPFDWRYSSLGEYCDETQDGICNFREVIRLSPERYKKFVLDQQSYQRSLSRIKSFLIDNYAG